MELYRGDSHTFMLAGSDFTDPRCVSKMAIAGKLHEIVVAMELFSLSQGATQVHEELGNARRAIDASDEQAEGACGGTP